MVSTRSPWQEVHAMNEQNSGTASVYYFSEIKKNNLIWLSMIFWYCNIFGEFRFCSYRFNITLILYDPQAEIHRFSKQ